MSSTTSTEKSTEKPDTKVTSPTGTTYDQINVYGITVYLQSQQSSSPMGIGVQCVAASPDEASLMVQDFYGDDIINASSPVTAIQNAFITAAPPPPSKRPHRPNPILPPEPDAHSEHGASRHAAGKK